MELPRLYKYCAPKRLDILEGKRIAFTPPARFSDVFDTKPNVVPYSSRRVLRQRVRELEPSVNSGLPAGFQSLPRHQRRKILAEFRKGFIDHMLKNADEFALGLEKGLTEGISKQFGILCLTAEPNHELMWTHYAEGHTGFLIEFHVDAAEFADHLGMPHKVIYSQEPPMYDPSKGSQGWWKVKRKSFDYENEYRIVRRLDECDPVAEPNGQLLYFRSMPLQAVKAIYLGLRSSPDTRKRLKLICKESRIEYFEAQFSKDRASIVFHRS